MNEYEFYTDWNPKFQFVRGSCYRYDYLQINFLKKIDFIYEFSFNFLKPRESDKVDPRINQKFRDKRRYLILLPFSNIISDGDKKIQF